MGPPLGQQLESLPAPETLREGNRAHAAIIVHGKSIESFFGRGRFFGEVLLGPGDQSALAEPPSDLLLFHPATLVLELTDDPTPAPHGFRASPFDSRREPSAHRGEFGFQFEGRDGHPERTEGGERLEP